MPAERYAAIIACRDLVAFDKRHLFECAGYSTPVAKLPLEVRLDAMIDAEEAARVAAAAGAAAAAVAVVPAVVDL